MKDYPEIRDFLSRHQLPTGDGAAASPSKGSFAGGAAFGIELSSANNATILRSLLALAKEHGIAVSRVDECRGMGRLPKADLVEMVRICAAEGVGLVLSVGPRAIYDTGGFVRSENGRRMGYRLRGMEQVVRAADEVRRAVDLGVRGFMVYDSGLLSLLNRMRDAGELPPRTTFKVSVHMGCANPLSARVYQDLGADSINPVPDLDLGMLAAMRAAVDCPLDLFADTADEAGGMIRTYDVPDFVRVAAPVYLKCGSSSQSRQNHLPSDAELRERIRQTVCVMETLARHGLAEAQVGADERTLGLPEV
ncbi:MAG: U32 family peptidase [Myxococcales bacterium]|nr:U32 family peptidase [Myxococcales bacterium]